jgi:hypothetical protein
MMKYHLLLPPVILALCGCHSDQYCQEQAVEMARKYIYKHARELTPEEFAFVKFTPPTLLTGNILGRNADNQIEKSLHGNEKCRSASRGGSPDGRPIIWFSVFPVPGWLTGRLHG